MKWYREGDWLDLRMPVRLSALVHTRDSGMEESSANKP